MPLGASGFEALAAVYLSSDFISNSTSITGNAFLLIISLVFSFRTT